MNNMKILDKAIGLNENQVFQLFNTSINGLKKNQVEKSREIYGKNVVTNGNKPSLAKKLVTAFVNPFTIILFALAITSAFTDIILAQPEDVNPVTVIIITVMVIVSGTLRHIQETRSENAAGKLKDMITTTACVKRYGQDQMEIPIDQIVVGDLIHLAAGDMIPADVKILSAKDLFVSQSSLTGESEPVEKVADYTSNPVPSPQNPSLAYMGTTVVSGTATAIALSVGDETMVGDLAKKLKEKPPATSFEKGVNSVSWVLIRFMLVMVPVVFFTNGIIKGDWMDAAFFAISIAVGLTPEMLPMIVTSCLAKSALTMAKEKVIIKKLNSIQNLGAINVLCTDKTGTLTQDKIVLRYHLDIDGNPDDRVLRHAFLNSYYQTGLRNLMDVAIIEGAQELPLVQGQQPLETQYQKVDEIPFDFQRRRMTVVVSDKSGKTQMITKGAIEEMLQISAYVEYQGQVVPLTDEMKDLVLAKVASYNKDGLRVLGVSQKTNPSPASAFSVSDEANMVLIGYLAFLDPPKETTADAIKALAKLGVEVKILTGDNEKVTGCICKQVGLPVNKILLGQDIEQMSQEELERAVEHTTVFAKLSPSEKARVVTALRSKGHTVGYMGDGINDTAAMKAADIGISVDTAVDIAKESADAILLSKDLMVLEKGIIEGRKTYANMIKYIKMTASSNFGNMFSVLAASAFLPFLPMASIHLILLNLIYDISCTAIPWDNVDKEFLRRPKTWDASSISRFMLFIGPTSSIFDIATYLLMYFIICPTLCGGSFQTLGPESQALFIAIFQTGWFVESMWSQTLVIHMIRTPKIPFLQSRASLPLTLLTFTAIGFLTLIPFTKLGLSIGLYPLPAMFFPWLIGIICCYMVVVTWVKKAYIGRYGQLL